MSDGKIRFGVAGTNSITDWFLKGAMLDKRFELAAVCSRNIDKAKAFGNKYGGAAAYSSINEMAESPDVDAVYIAVPNSVHAQYALACMNAGKHVLCEKPIGFTKAESAEMYSYAMEHGLVLMEAVKTAYCPGFQQLINTAKSGKIGRICDVEACFTRLADPKSRERSDARYGGSFLEFGSYTLLPAIKLLGSHYTNLQFQTIYGEDGVDLYTKVELTYPDAMATAKNGVAVKSEGQLVIAGTKGYILAPSPWWLTRRFEIHDEDASRVEVYEPVVQGDGFRYEIS